MSNLHVNLDEANKHDPKGFIPAPNNTYPVKDERGLSYYEERMSLPKAINFVDGTAAPPTTADFDVYVLTGSGTEDAGWGTAVFGDWVRFFNGIPTPITPLAGYRCFDETSGTWKEYNGSNWVAGDANTTNLSIGTITATTVDINSDTGTDATIPSATASDAGLMSATKFNEVVANNAKVTNATHTGEVTGSGALTVDKTVISNKTLVTADGADHVLIGDASDADNLKKVLVSDFLGAGGGNLGDTNLTLSGATVRTYNVDGNELRFIDGANSLFKIHPNTVVVGGATPVAGTKFLSRGDTNVGGSTAFKATSLSGKNFVEFENDGQVNLESQAIATVLKFKNAQVGNAGVSDIYFYDQANAHKGTIRFGNLNWANSLEADAISFKAKGTNGMVFHDLNSNHFKWDFASQTDGSVHMKLDTNGLKLGTGIGALTDDIRLIVKGRTTSSILNTDWRDSNNATLMSLSNQGKWLLEPTVVIDRDHKIGSPGASNYTALNFTTDGGSLGHIIVAGSTASFGGNALLTDSFGFNANAAATRFNIQDQSANGIHFIFGGAENTNVDGIFNSTGLKLGNGIGGTAVGAKLHVDGTIRIDNQTATGATAGADTLPANPVGFININLDGTVYKVPYYAV